MWKRLPNERSYLFRKAPIGAFSLIDSSFGSECLKTSLLKSREGLSTDSVVRERSIVDLDLNYSPSEWSLREVRSVGLRFKAVIYASKGGAS